MIFLTDRDSIKEEAEDCISIAVTYGYFNNGDIMNFTIFILSDTLPVKGIVCSSLNCCFIIFRSKTYKYP